MKGKMMAMKVMTKVGTMVPRREIRLVGLMVHCLVQKMDHLSEMKMVLPWVQLMAY